MFAPLPISLLLFSLCLSASDYSSGSPLPFSLPLFLLLFHFASPPSTFLPPLLFLSLCLPFFCSHFASLSSTSFRLSSSFLSASLSSTLILPLFLLLSVHPSCIFPFHRPSVSLNFPSLPPVLSLLPSVFLFPPFKLHIYLFLPCLLFPCLCSPSVLVFSISVVSSLFELTLDLTSPLRMSSFPLPPQFLSTSLPSQGLL
eukprot:TRINITY_DN915_c0_g1_i2.p2 TRINITY_DN915_c0_g1~~TRINITY_DN915_c0_g1_i2.p2  ORF type:complete len:200 (-),score=45.08 TRINITY_DN915_c0_g1_i2:110-709(-)